MNLIENATKEVFFQMSKNKKIIIFGTGYLFREALMDLLRNEIESIDVIIDNNQCKQGNSILLGEKKIEINSADVLYKLVLSEYCLLITPKYYKEIVEQLRKMNLQEQFDCFIYNDIKYNFSILDIAIHQIKALEYRISGDLDLSEKKAESKRNDILKKDDYFIVPRLNFIVTQKCSLSCKDCNALIPYIKHPQHIPLENVLEEIDIILDVADEVVCMEPIGGEPFVYPYLAEVLEYMVDSEKVDYVTIATNGTVVPNERLINVLKNPKIHVEMSDYGNIESMSKLVSCLEKNKISFDIVTNEIWNDVGGYEFRNRNYEELIEAFKKCYCEMKFIYDNKIWVCTRAPRLSMLGVTNEHDYFCLEYGNKKKNRESIENVYNLKFADSCNYCGRGDAYVKNIPAGIQTDNRITKSEYTLIKRSEYERLLNIGKNHEW